MLTKSIPPTTKTQLIQSIQRITIDKMFVTDVSSKNQLKPIMKDLETLLGNASKPVSVIAIRSR